MRAGVVSFAWAPAYSVPLAPLKAGSTVTLAKKDNDGKNWNKHGKHNWNDNGKNYKWSGKGHGGKKWSKYNNWQLPAALYHRTIAGDYAAVSEPASFLPSQMK